MNNPGIISHGRRNKYRKQVIFMLGAVVISFFICLLPFRVFTLWIIIVPFESVLNLGANTYYFILYFCRILLYLNSAMNPILYNLMSTKFRDGFIRMLGLKSLIKGHTLPGARKGTFHTTSTNLSSSQNSEKKHVNRIRASMTNVSSSSSSMKTNKSLEKLRKQYSMSEVSSGCTNDNIRIEKIENMNELDMLPQSTTTIFLKVNTKRITTTMSSSLLKENYPNNMCEQMHINHFDKTYSDPEAAHVLTESVEHEIFEPNEGLICNDAMCT